MGVLLMLKIVFYKKRVYYNRVFSKKRGNKIIFQLSYCDLRKSKKENLKFSKIYLFAVFKASVYEAFVTFKIH